MSFADDDEDDGIAVLTTYHISLVPNRKECKRLLVNDEQSIYAPTLLIVETQQDKLFGIIQIAQSTCGIAQPFLRRFA